MPTLFISYKRDDRVAVLPISERLEHEFHYDIWIDAKSIPGGEDWRGEIRKGIDKASEVLLMLTPDSCASPQVKEEIDYAKSIGRKIIPLQIRKVASSDLEALGVEALNYIDFVSSHDARFAWEQLIKWLTPIQSELNERHPDQKSRQMEIEYLQAVMEDYDKFREKYTPIRTVAKIDNRVDERHLLSITPNYIISKLDATFGTSSETNDEVFDDVIEAILKHKDVVILGSPGSGKTTILQTLAARLAEKAIIDAASPIPLYIELPKLYPSKTIGEHIKEQYGDSLQNAARQGRIAFLLDGLNELPYEKRDERICGLSTIAEDSRKAGRICVFTCRTLDINLSANLGSKNQLRLTPLDPKRIYDFCSNYLGAQGEHLFWTLAGAEATIFWETWKQEKRGDLKSMWESDEECNTLEWDINFFIRNLREAMRNGTKSRQLLTLAQNPFMLFMLIIVYDRHKTLPTNRSKLFQYFIDVLFEREKLSEAQSHSLINKLAEFAFSLRETGSSTAVPRAMVKESLSEPELYLALNTTLLEGEDTISFSHELLNEYCAALHLKRKIQDGDTANRYWNTENWWEHNTKWDEAVILLAGMFENDCTVIVNWLGDANPNLAERCITESGAHVPESTLNSLGKSWVQRLVNLKEEPGALASIGRVTGKLNLDDRSGVGIVRNIPDIQWCEIKTGNAIVGGDPEVLDVFDPQPLLQVPVVYDFWISKYPVTYAQFYPFVDTGYVQDQFWTRAGLQWRAKRVTPSFWDNRFWNLSNHPVIGVTWFEAVAYTNWLNQLLEREHRFSRKGLQVRLPTEIEWEKAARGPKGRLFSYGNEPIAEAANNYSKIPRAERDQHKDYSISEAVDDVFADWDSVRYLARTSAVGIFAQDNSPYGIMDVCGNVQEWLISPWTEDYDLGQVADLEGNGQRLIKGGSWKFHANVARCASRASAPPSTSSTTLGFRLCLSTRV
jgi:formylglycine-generating enzyme required for sulfatase activity/energy-coupling factor transporter ATP-binding protein EcfA2